MSLLNPKPGDFLDRLTILALKGTSAKLTLGSTAHVEQWRHESDGILEQVYPLLQKSPVTVWVVPVLRLAALNGLLWQAEDDLRKLAKDFTAGINRSNDPFREVAMRIQSLNEQRAALAAEISTVLSGHTVLSDKFRPAGEFEEPES